MNRKVIERLISNLKEPPITHDQLNWLNGSNEFVIDDSDRWSCATRGCAAGFIFLEEAPEGYVLDIVSERVFSPEEWKQLKEDALVIDESDVFSELAITELKRTRGKSIVNWGAGVLGISEERACDLFYNFGDTDEILEDLEALLKLDE